MIKLEIKSQIDSGLSFTYFIAICCCGLLISTTVFGQPTQTVNVPSPDNSTSSVGPTPLQPIWGHSDNEETLQDLPSYRMAREAIADEADYRQPLPTPSSQPTAPAPDGQDEVLAQYDPIDAIQQETLMVESERTTQRETLGSVLDNTPDFDIPTLVHWTPQQWSRLELKTGERFEQSLANPLQRYEPLFEQDGPYVPSAHTHPYGTVPLVLNSHVERNLDYFQVGIPDRFQSYLDRYEKYKNLVEQIFIEFGLPPELGHLSLVESGFNPRAYSRARASGPWQFMKATGRMYGLNVSWYVDERRDPVKSTIAAAHHLRDLYDQFGSWPLALGAYNAGGGKISRAIRRTGTRDFWKIRRTWYIRRETKEYVPRFIAATLIASHPSDYGFSVAQVEPYSYDEVLIHKRVHLKAVAKTTGITFENLRELNPELRRSIVPSQRKGYPLKVPAGMGPVVKKQHDRIQPWTQPAPPPTTWYRVRYGDNLSVVAKRYGMKVRALKRLNRLSGNLIRVGQRLRVRAHDAPVDLKSRWYTVRRGDNLSDIAQRFGTSITAIKRLNNLSGNLIRVGDKLQLRGKPNTVARQGEKWYRVRRGDSLWEIAKRFRVSVRDLKVLNNLTTSFIRVGHLLLIK